MLRVAVARTPDRTAPVDDAAPGWMGDAERRRRAGLAGAARRDFDASRRLLRALLADATGVPAEAWEVSAQAGAAPVARTLAGDAAAPRASLSHRLGWVAAAVADGAVGVDVECERPPRSDAGERAALMLSPAELAGWQALPPGRREAALLTRWTVKEAWFKAFPGDDAPWDFRQILARACDPASANVRAWTSAPLHVALCHADARALGDAHCAGLDAAATASSFWHVAHAPSAG